MKRFTPYLAAVILTGIVFVFQQGRIDELKTQLGENEAIHKGESQDSSAPYDSPNRVVSKIKTRRISDDPQIYLPNSEELISRGTALSIPSLYGDFINVLGLTEEETRYFQALLVRRLTAHREMGEEWPRSQKFQSNQAEIRQFLNHSEDFAAFNRYEQDLFQRQRDELIERASEKR